MARPLMVLVMTSVSALSAFPAFAVDIENRDDKARSVFIDENGMVQEMALPARTLTPDVCTNCRLKLEKDISWLDVEGNDLVILRDSILKIGG